MLLVLRCASNGLHFRYIAAKRESVGRDSGRLRLVPRATVPLRFRIASWNRERRDALGPRASRRLAVATRAQSKFVRSGAMRFVPAGGLSGSVAAQGQDRSPRTRRGRRAARPRPCRCPDHAIGCHGRGEARAAGAREPARAGARRAPRGRSPRSPPGAASPARAAARPFRASQMDGGYRSADALARSADSHAPIPPTRSVTAGRPPQRIRLQAIAER